MKKVIVNLNEIKMLNEFIHAVSTFESNIDAVRDHYIVDAKSIMGVMSIDLSKPLEIVINSNNEEELARFEKVMKNFS